MEFGFLSENICYETEDCKISPLGNFSDKIKALQSEGLIHDGWLYPPCEEPSRRHNDPDKLPKIPCRAFSLTPTHIIETKNGLYEKDREEFLINVLGFIKGVKLVPSEWSHFYRVPINLHKLVGFVCTKGETQSLLEISNHFYSTHDIEVRKMFFGAVHWFLFADSYYHDFERFDCQYKVLDACYKLTRNIFNIKECGHNKRPNEMCKFFNLPTPLWAKLDGGISNLSTLRNQFYHEALFAGEPIGFNIPDSDIVFELKNFNAKLLLSILGVKAKYIKYPADKEYSMHALNMES